MCESRSEPTLLTAEHQASATPTQTIVSHEAFACRCAVVAARVCTHSCRLGTFHCTQFRQGSAAFLFNC